VSGSFLSVSFVRDLDRVRPPSHRMATQPLVTPIHDHLTCIVTYLHAEYLDETIAGARRDVFAKIVQLRIVDRGLMAGLELTQH
jgi:hypothetical protein